MPLDVGCGFGRSFRVCSRSVSRRSEALRRAAKQAERDGLSVELLRANSSDLPLPSEMANALREFHRILKPGGPLLVAESTRAHIHSWIIRLVFRHSMHVQRTADECLAMVRVAAAKR